MSLMVALTFLGVVYYYLKSEIATLGLLRIFFFLKSNGSSLVSQPIT